MESLYREKQYIKNKMSDVRDIIYSNDVGFDM